MRRHISIEQLRPGMYVVGLDLPWFKTPTANIETMACQAWGRKKPRWQWFLDSEEVGPVIDPEPFQDEVEASGGFGDSSLGTNGESGREMTNKYFLCPSLKLKIY